MNAIWLSEQQTAQMGGFGWL